MFNKRITLGFKRIDGVIFQIYSQRNKIILEADFIIKEDQKEFLSKTDKYIMGYEYNYNKV